MMHNSQTVGMGAPSAAATLADTKLGQVGIALAGSALIAVCAHISIPLWFTPVPVTMQPFAVLLLGLMLSPRVAFGAAAAYLIEGAAGLPAFTPNGPGGVAQLFGFTGGYLLSYPVVAPLVSAWFRKGAKSFRRALLVAGAGSLVTLSMGAVRLGVVTHASASIVLTHAVLPFLPGDVLKVCAAAGIAAGAARLGRRTGTD
jgi:biotin transport system substrate-specific component